MNTTLVSSFIDIGREYHSEDNREEIRKKYISNVAALLATKLPVCLFVEEDTLLALQNHIHDKTRVFVVTKEMITSFWKSLCDDETFDTTAVRQKMKESVTSGKIYKNYISNLEKISPDVFKKISFYCYKYKKDTATALSFIKLERETQIHNDFYALLTHFKMFCIQQAVNANPFSSEYFMWCDANRMCSHITSVGIREWECFVMKKQIHACFFTEVYPLTMFHFHNIPMNIQEALTGKPLNMIIKGTIMGFRGNTFQSFLDAYKRKVKDFTQNELLPVEENVLTSLCHSNINVVHLYGNQWWNMLTGVYTHTDQICSYESFLK